MIMGVLASRDHHAHIESKNQYLTTQFQFDSILSFKLDVLKT